MSAQSSGLDGYHIRDPERWGRHIRWALSQDYDQLVLFTGREGTGKSTGGFHLCRSVDTAFHLGRIGWRGWDHIRNSLAAPKRAAVMWDETSRGGDGRRAMGQENVDVINHLAECRALNQLHVLCKPSLHSFDPRIRETRAHWWVHLEDRGLAKVFYPVRGAHAKKTWWDYRFDLHVPKASGPMWDEYAKLKDEHTQRNSAENIDDDNAILPLVGHVAEVRAERHARAAAVAQQILAYKPPKQRGYGFRPVPKH